MIDRILHYFPNLDARQQQQFMTMMQLYPEWNDKINVISRKDIDNLEVNHLLHSLAIAKFIQFIPGSNILDLGCGGGLPGLPLAVFSPEVSFHLVDRTGKKIKVASEIAKECGLQNVTFQHGDAGECKRAFFDFVVSRAVMNLPDLIKIARPLISRKSNHGYPNGLITLKGGAIDEEISKFKSSTLVESLRNYFPEDDYFTTKMLTYTAI